MKLLLILLFFLNIAHASWYDYSDVKDTSLISKDGKKCRSMGWHFYCQEDKKDEEEVTMSYEELKTLPIEQRYQVALKRQEEWQRQEKARLALAVTYPDAEHTKLWQEHKEKASEQASKFNREHKKMLLGHPDLDYTVKHPVSSTGSYIATDLKNNTKREILATLNKDYGLYFLYTTSCKYCVAYGHILNDFRQQYNLSIIGISMDGYFLGDWPDSIVNNGQAESLGIGEALPFTLLFDKNKQQVIPLGAGLITEDILIERIYSQIGVSDD